MFSGIVEGLCKVTKIEKQPEFSRICIDMQELVEGVRVGDSISVNGACLTVVSLDNTAAKFDVVDETLKKTNLGKLKKGDMVDIERSMRMGDRLGGHFVLGHVDGVGTIVEKNVYGDNCIMRIRVPKELSLYLIEKGSVGVDGISLTLFDAKDNTFTVALIPHTLDVTTLGTKKEGDTVNIEADYIGKWIKRLLPKLSETKGGR
jgi:riboflavin synthase